MVPSVTPRTTHSISARSSAAPSRLRRMMSTNRRSQSIEEVQAGRIGRPVSCYKIGSSNVSKLIPEVSRGVTAVARGLVAAARAAALYPPEHPAAQAALARLEQSLHEATSGLPYSLGVAPDTLLIDGVSIPAREGPVAEAAALLHDRGLLRVTFDGDVPAPGLLAFLQLLARDPTEVRERGGPATVWVETGHPAIELEQIDYKRVLEDKETRAPHERKDDLWHSIVRSIVDRRKVLDEAAQRELLEIAGHVDSIEALAGDVAAPHCTGDGSPMLMTQVATVLAAYRQLTNIVATLSPARVDETMRNIAAATSRLNPQLVMQVLTSEEDPQTAGGGGVAVVKGISAAFDDMKVAQLLAATLAMEGHASNRLAAVFDTIAPDEERKRRVLTLTRSLLGEADFGRRDQFQAIWQSMEALLVTYNEKPFVSAQYRAGLDGIQERASVMAVDLPAEASGWIATLGQENVRRLSVQLLIDLLKLEEDRARANDLTTDMAGVAEDLLLSGDYADAVEVVKALAETGANPQAIARDGARTALDHLGTSLGLRETVALLDEMDQDDYARVRAFCETVGPSCVDALHPALAVEQETRARNRAAEMIMDHTGAGVGRLAPLIGHKDWFAQRNAAVLIGRIGAAEGVPLLQGLLRSPDARVASEAVRGLASINDPAAARAIHTALRVASGPARKAVVDALVAMRDPRVVPVLVRILSESRPLGSDHPIVLETLAAMATLADERAVPAVAATLRHRSFFARARTRAVREAAVGTLARIGGAQAGAALKDAATRGDRMLRKIAAPVAARRTS
jgi:hypothetical protein